MASAVHGWWSGGSYAKTLPTLFVSYFHGRGSRTRAFKTYPAQHHRAYAGAPTALLRSVTVPTAAQALQHHILTARSGIRAHDCWGDSTCWERPESGCRVQQLST